MKILLVLLTFLVFDAINAAAITEICTDPGIQCEGQGDTTKVPDPNDCQAYYICIGGSLGGGGEPFPCPEGQIFDQTAGDCVDGDTCVAICDPTTTVASTTPVPPTIPPVYCKTVCVEGVDYIPDPNDCSIYYLCGPQQPYQKKTCPTETPNFDGDSCQNDSSVCCDACDPYCDADHLNKQIADPEDCRAFYFCNEVGAAKNHGTCSTGKVFYSINGKCVTGDDCDDYCSTTTISTTTISTTTNSTTANLVATTTPMATETPVTRPPGDCNNPDNVCVGIDDDEYVGDLFECHTYYQCTSGFISLPFECASGQYFDGTECSEETTPCLTACLVLCLKECPATGGISYMADPVDCNVYYICSAGVQSAKQFCSVENPYFTGSTCDNDPKYCCDVCVPYCESDRLGLGIQNPSNCTQYYLCEAEGEPTEERSCGASEYYDEDANDCLSGTCQSYCTV